MIASGQDKTFCYICN